MDAPKLNPQDTLKQSYPKLNQAIDNANEALTKSNTAIADSAEALSNSENTQQQLDTIVIEGDSSVEAAQARVDSDNNTFATLKERLDTKEDSFTAQLAQKASHKEVDSKVSQIVSGSPKAVFATLSELQTAYPSGTDGIFLVGTDWYYWDGTAWIYGGVYQGTESQQFIDVTGFFATNIIKNGDFIYNTSFENWVGRYTTFIEENGMAKGITQDGQASGRINQSFNGFASHKYYIGLYAEIPDTSKFSEVKLDIAAEQTGDSNTVLFPVTQEFANGKRVSAILNGFVDGTNWFRISFIKSNTTESGTIFYIDKALIIDLTEAYGLGNEPSLYEMDSLLSKYPNSWFDTKGVVLGMRELYENMADKDDIDELRSQIDGLGNNREDKRPIALSKPLSPANGMYNWNGGSFIQDNVTNFNDNQYVVYVDTDKKPYIAKRELPNGEWELFDLSTIVGNPLKSPIVYDNHNVLVVAVDSDGYIHVSGNQHNVPIQYIRSVSPGDITSWEIPAMTGNETSVTYPQFVKLKDGTLLFFYRNGVSGNGDTRLNVYNTATKTWAERQANFINATLSEESAYINHVAVDKDNVIHVMWTWRGTGNASTNNDISYAKSSDAGVTWEKADGTTYALPITHDTAEIILDTAPTGSGIINQCGLEVDDKGRPHGAFFLYDLNGNTQIIHVWHDHSLWHVDYVTNFSYRYETNTSIVDYTISRPSVFTTKDGRVYIMYKHRAEHRGSVRCIDVTPGVEYYDDFPIMNLDLHDWEPTFDTQALYERNELVMLIMKTQGNGSQSAEWNDGDNWNYHFAAIITYDLNQFGKVQRGEVKLPQIREINTMVRTIDDSITVTNTSAQDIEGGSLLVAEDWNTHILFAKMKIRGSITGGTVCRTRIKELDESSSITELYGSINLTSTERKIATTPWIPLRNLPNDFGGFITFNSYVDAGTANLSILQLELGVLDI